MVYVAILRNSGDVESLSTDHNRLFSFSAMLQMLCYGRFSSWLTSVMVAVAPNCIHIYNSVFN